MEQTDEINRLAEHKKQKKKKDLYNNKNNQVTPNLTDGHQNELNMINHKLNIDPCTSSNENTVNPKSIFSSSLCTNDNNKKSEHLTNSNSVANDFMEKLYLSSSSSNPRSDLKQTDSSTVNVLPLNNILIDKNSVKNEISTSGLENIYNGSILENTNLTQFEKCKDNENVRCRLCHLIISYDIPILIEHVSKCKRPNENKFNYIQKFNCFICDKITRKLKDWKLHVVSNDHLEKCKIKNDYVSYVCGGCKAVFFGNKEQILNHCIEFHKDISGLPCIFKCMRDVFFHSTFVKHNNWKSWTYCGPCKKYSSNKVNCFSPNHNIRKTKHFKCESCSIDFMCSQDIYDNHLLSCEHNMLDYLRTVYNKKPESLTKCNLKLPPIFLNKFNVDNEKATCNDCKFQMFPNEKEIIAHLTQCIHKPSIDKKSLKTINMYFCAVCNKTMSDISQWETHLISSSHLTKCHSINDLVSFTCELCSLHCYGNLHHVTEHQDIHPNNSGKNLSKFMAFNFLRINKDWKSKIFYYCEDCEIYAEINLTSDHWNKSHTTRLKRIICHPCRTEFFCIEGNELFLKHKLSSEHIVLKYIAEAKNPSLELSTSSSSKPKKSNVFNENQKTCNPKNTLETIKNQVPSIFKSYLNWFKNLEDKNKAACLACDVLIDVDENALLSHLLVCNQVSSENILKTNIKFFQCLECQLHSNNYNTWEEHAISHIKLEINFLYSYFCISCSSLLYGKMVDIESHLYNEHHEISKDMPLETVLMAKQLMRRNNARKSLNVMCFCEPCKRIFKAFDSCNHFNTDSHASIASDLVELFYCKYCEVEFYSSNTVYERHKLTAEHIIMSLDYKSSDIKTPLKPLKLDIHLIKFVSNQKLYNTTQNIGFFCFVCDYLCLSLDIWKIHINGKKHIKSSKDYYMDHRCKICKTLLFGQREHIIEHYSNRFHSMLRLFKSEKLSTNVLTQNDNLSIKNFERKFVENNSDNNQRVENYGNKLEEPMVSNNKINVLTDMISKLSGQSNVEQDGSIQEELTTSETHSVTKPIDQFLVESNIQPDSNLFDKSNNNINKKHSMTRKVYEFPPKSNSQNYNHFYELRLCMLNELFNQNKETTPQIVMYCLPCDFITVAQNCWDEHLLDSHSNDVKMLHRVFCDICNLYQFGPCDNLDGHNNTVEHKTMLDFIKTRNIKKSNIKTIEKDENKTNTISNQPSNAAKTSVIDNQEINITKKDVKETSNHNIMVEVKGAKAKYKRNSWAELKKIFSTYGYFRLYPKQNSVMIMFRKMHSVFKVMKDQKKLENTYDFIICMFIEEDNLPELNKTTEYEFGNKDLLMQNMDTLMMAIIDEISNPSILHRLVALINSVQHCAGQYFINCKTYTFGSRMSGLALKDSDVDLYFDIGNTFGGELSNDLFAQEDLVRYFGKVFRFKSIEFKNVQLITGARVPIVKFFHVPSGLNCDLSFKSGLSTHNTKLVRLYLTLDNRVHWIVCTVVKRWALQNDLKNQSMFTSYALAWLVLFYLMTTDVVPPLKLLRDNADYSEDKTRSDVMFIEDWDCTFCSREKAQQLWKVPEIPKWDLLFGFFKFYSDPDRLKQFVFCPAIGKAIPKEQFFDVPMKNPDILGFYKKKCGEATQWCAKLRDNFHGEGLAVQDPFDLFHNITKTIGLKKLQGFSHLCCKTLEVMNKSIQPPYYA